MKTDDLISARASERQHQASRVSAGEIIAKDANVYIDTGAAPRIMPFGGDSLSEI